MAQVWKYLRVVINNKNNQITFVTVNGRPYDGYIGHEVNAAKLDIFNRLGQEYWELATADSVWIGDVLSVEYILKRPYIPIALE